MTIAPPTSSDYWVFSTPIAESWIASEEIRRALETGANAKTVLSDDVKAVLVENIRSWIECEL